jgi:hypothetical protein
MTWLAIALLILLPANAAAQPVKGDWQRVEKLSTGSRVRVVARDGARLSGAIVAVSSDSLTMIVKGQSRSLPMGDLVRVQTRSRTQRLLLGAILVPAGMLVGAMLCPGCSIDGFASNNFVLVGAAAGAVSWLAPMYVTIYEVRPT